MMQPVNYLINWFTKQAIWPNHIQDLLIADCSQYNPSDMLVYHIFASMEMIHQLMNCPSLELYHRRLACGLEILIERCLPLLDPLKSLAKKSNDDNDGYRISLEALKELLSEIKAVDDQLHKDPLLMADMANNEDNLSTYNHNRFNMTQVQYYTEKLASYYIRLSEINKSLRGTSLIQNDLRIVCRIDERFVTLLRTHLMKSIYSHDKFMSHHPETLLQFFKLLQMSTISDGSGLPPRGISSYDSMAIFESSSYSSMSCRSESIDRTIACSLDSLPFAAMSGSGKILCDTYDSSTSILSMTTTTSSDPSHSKMSMIKSNRPNIPSLALPKKLSADDMMNKNLFEAVWKGDLKAVDNIIYNSKADISHVRDEHGNTLLHTAAAYGKIDIILYLLFSNLSVNAVNKNGNTPLLLAAGNNFPKAVSLLLSMGANPHLKNKCKMTARDQAKKKGHHDIKRILKQAMGIPIGGLWRQILGFPSKQLAIDDSSSCSWKSILLCDEDDDLMRLGSVTKSTP